MCPLPEPIGPYFTDEQIFLFLKQYIHGSALPGDVLDDVDVNLYQTLPSVLPPDMWYYIVNSGRPKETENGFWKAKGDASEIFEDSLIKGRRTTLEFFGRNGLKTDWVMQEYMITEKGADKENRKPSRALCRVFQCSDASPNPAPVVVPNTNSSSTMAPKTNSNIIEVHKTETDNTPNGDFLELDDLVDDVLPEVWRAEEDVLFDGYLELNDLDEGIPKPRVVEMTKSPLLEDLSDPTSREAFLELDDLADAEFASHSSSSVNTSHRKSDEFFALLKERDEEKSQELHVSRFMSQHAQSESMINESKTETQAASSTNPKSSSVDKRPKPEEARSEGSSSDSASSRRHRKKKFKKYFCFIPF